MKIVVLDDWGGVFRDLTCYSRLKDHEVVVYRDNEEDVDKVAQRLQDADAVILTQKRTRFPRAVIEKLSRLKLVAQTGNHRDHIDIAACTEKGIIVANPSGIGLGVATAELTWGLILASLRHIPLEFERMKQGEWHTTVGTGLRGKTLGIYAPGGIGSVVARIGRAFEMNVTCWGGEDLRTNAAEQGYIMPATRAQFFESADVISLHIYYNKETREEYPRDTITAADLARMKPMSLLVNTSRARLIQPGALVDALQRGRPGRAALDVYDVEPIPKDHPLLKMPNVLCTPHLGYATDSTFEALYEKAVDSILGYAAGKPVNVINPSVL